MSEPLPTPESPGMDANLKPGPSPQAPSAPADVVVYRPISGWAIAGFGAGLLFSLFTILTTAVALWQGVPFFLHPSIVFLAIAGVVLSCLGQRQVQNSEGTRAGAKLAQVGLWLSLVSGLSYLSYYFVTGLALQNQAHAFLMDKTDDDSGFFPRLAEGANDPVQMNRAFLLTRKPREREGVKPEIELVMVDRFDVYNKDGNPGELSVFKYGTAPQSLFTALPRIFFKGQAKEVKILEQGVQEWKYESKTYMVARKYRIESKELQWDVVLMVCSSEGEGAGQGRKWYLHLGMSGITATKLTDFGQGMKFLRLHARMELEHFILRLNRGEAYPDIKELDRTSWDSRFGADPRAKRELIHKLFADKSEKRIDQFKIWTNPGDEIGHFEEVDGKIRVYQTFRFVVPKSLAPPTGYNVDGYWIIESIKSVDPAQFAPHSPSPGWRPMQVVFTGIREVPLAGPEGKGRP